MRGRQPFDDRSLSERGKDHEDLVTGVVGCESEGCGPATDLSPSEPSVEVLQPLASPGREVQLFKAQLIAGDLPELVDEGGSDAASAEGGAGLQMMDRAPVSDESVGVAVEDDPSGQEAVGAGDEKSALLRVEAAEELVRDRGDVVLADRRERELAAPPVLVTVTQQSINSRRSSGATSRGSVICTRSRALSCGMRRRMPEGSDILAPVRISWCVRRLRPMQFRVRRDAFGAGAPGRSYTCWRGLPGGPWWCLAFSPGLGAHVRAHPEQYQCHRCGAAGVVRLVSRQSAR